MMRNHHTRLACRAIVSFVLASFPPLVLAKVEPMTLKELVAGSDLITVVGWCSRSSRTVHLLTRAGGGLAVR